jgi:hypothetical protein
MGPQDRGNTTLSREGSAESIATILVSDEAPTSDAIGSSHPPSPLVKRDVPVRWGIAFAGGLAVLLASFVNFLIFNNYPLLRPDVAIVIAGIAVLCAALARIYVGMPRLVQALMEGCLIGFIIDLNSRQAAVAFGVGVVVLLFVYIAKTSILRFSAIIGTFVIVTSLLGFSERKPWIVTETSATAPRHTVANQPAIVHIILDEHIGVEGIPQDSPEGKALKADLQAFYQSRGFALFGRAYSEHLHTVNAVPHILNFGERLALKASKSGVRIGQTAYFENLRKSGYRLHILQSEFADFCSDAKADTCTTYNSASLYPTLAFSMGITDRASLIAYKFVMLASWGKYFDWKSLTSSIPAEQAFRNFAEQVRGAQPGGLYLAHILLPHYPYAFDRNCRDLPRSAWRRRKGAETLGERQHAYFGQARCAANRLDMVLNTLARSPAGANSMVIVHGDHGSRLTTVDPKADNAGRYTSDDMVAGYSTLFAVRGPRITPGYRTYPIAAAGLLRDLTQSGFQVPHEPESAGEATVVVDDDDWRPSHRVPLPNSWQPKNLGKP